MKARWKPRFLFGLLMMCLLTSGCNKTTIVRTSLVRIPEDLNGLLYVSEGKPIGVGVEGKDAFYEVDVDGYYLIHWSDLKSLLDAAKKGIK